MALRCGFDLGAVSKSYVWMNGTEKVDGSPEFACWQNLEQSCPLCCEADCSVQVTWIQESPGDLRWFTRISVDN